MDVPLYAVALAFFAVLYLAIGVFLLFTVLISLVAMFVFLTLRYGNVGENYPHSAGDVAITAIFVGITWAIFVFVGPKAPIPLVGSGLTYQASNVVPVTAIIAIAFFVMVGFLAVFSLAADHLPRMAAGQGAGGGFVAPEGATGEKPKQGVGV